MSMACPHCGGEVSANARACGHCGRWLTEQAADRTMGLEEATLAAYERRPAASPALSVERATSAFAWLVVVGAPERGEIGRAVALRPGSTTLGRSRRSGNDVVLNDKACSSVHARIALEPRPGQKPAFVLLDAGSRNGVRVAQGGSAGQGRKVERHELQDGDRILLGETELVFKRV